MKSIFLVLFLFCVMQVHGRCGIENCKRTTIVKKNKSLFEVELGMRYTNFTFQDEDGTYEEVSLSLCYIHQSNWLLDVKVPYTFFQYEGQETNGFSNPVLNAENWFTLDKFSPLFGLQFEIPIGEEDKGITPGHWELLPYLGTGFNFNTYSLRMVVGYRFSLGADEHAEAEPTTTGKKFAAGHNEEAGVLSTVEIASQVVNFHAKEEVQFFFSGGKSFYHDRLVLGLQNTVRQVIEGEEKLLLIYGGPTLQFNHNSFKLQSQFNIPFSSDKKMNWDIGLSLVFGF